MFSKLYFMKKQTHNNLKSLLKINNRIVRKHGKGSKVKPKFFIKFYQNCFRMYLIYKLRRALASSTDFISR